MYVCVGVCVCVGVRVCMYVGDHVLTVTLLFIFINYITVHKNTTQTYTLILINSRPLPLCLINTASHNSTLCFQDMTTSNPVTPSVSNLEKVVHESEEICAPKATRGIRIISCACLLLM